MQIHRAVFRSLQHGIRKNLPVCNHGDDVGLEGLQLFNHFRIPEGHRLENRNPVFKRTFLDRGKAGLHTAAPCLVRLGINRTDLKSVPDQLFQ